MRLVVSIDNPADSEIVLSSLCKDPEMEAEAGRTDIAPEYHAF